jgi:hypothetical protein
MAADDSSSRPTASLARRPGQAATPWRGDEHRVRVEAAAEVGLPRSQVELELYTDGFASGMTVEDPFDGAIVARGRTVLRESELHRSLRPVLQYLGVGPDAIALRVHDGSFELRVGKHVAEASHPALASGQRTLRLWLGAAFVGALCYWLVAPAVAGVVWSVGLLLGGWQLRRGMSGGRAMLAGRVAMGLGMLAQAEKVILPPCDAPTDEQDPR